MKILFLTIGKFISIRQQGLYPDLLRTFMNHGHEVYIVSSRERREKHLTEIVQEDNSIQLMVKIGNITKTNLIEKGISTIRIEKQYKAAIQKYFSNVKFDLVLYSTPPITLEKVVSYVKKRDGAKSYLLLKDIFPQNAVDLEMLSLSGIKGMMYRYFRKREKQLYAISDHIGCMSEANANYVIKHNPEVDSAIVEVCPNSIEIKNICLTNKEKRDLRKKYGLPIDKTIFVYGGNLGRPQGIPFVINCLKKCIGNQHAFFLIVGDGTEYYHLENFLYIENPRNVKLMKSLPKEDYDQMIAACDVGLIFLDHRFTIPNFPSRVLSYMQAGIPVLACTDRNTDIGEIIVSNGFGWWCESNNVQEFSQCIEAVCEENLKKIGFLGHQYLRIMYDVEKSYNIIIKSYNEQ